MATLVEGILRTLIEAGGAPVSGEALAKELGVTRAGVWKAVEGLRAQGYGVESVKGLGYSLKGGSGKLRAGEIAALLKTREIGREVRCFAETDSTNRQAAKWADEGAPHGALVTAECQTAGRGRLGRNWFGAPGESLLFSLVLRPETGIESAPLITFISAVSMARTLVRWVPEEAVEIKWPNDLLVNGRKVAGILLESRIEGARLDYVVLGVGINVGGEKKSFPAEISGTAGTVAEFAGEKNPSLLEVLSAYLETFEEDYRLFLERGFAPLKKEWETRFKMAGKAVSVSFRDETVEGIVLGLGDDGSLLLKAPSGERKILAGDVHLATTKKKAG